MAEVAKGIIDIEINTGDASAALKQLQAQVNAFNLTLNKANKAQGSFAADYANEFKLAIEKTGLFTAETIKLATAASTLDKTLGKGKVTLGQFFSAKFNKDSAMAAEVMALAAERAKAMQTQFIATSGAAKGMQDALAVRPLAAFSSETAVASQRAEILSSMFKQGTTQLINFGKNVQWAGRQLMVGFTVPLTIFGNTAGKTFMELEKQVVSFKKVYGDLFTTPAEVNKNLEAVKGLASEYTKYGIAVKDTIGLAAQAAAAGRQNKDLTDAVSQATRLATLGQMDQNAALETTISLQSAFKLSGQDLADTINFLNMVENQTVVSLQDISAAIPRVAPVIQGLGGDVKDLTVFLAAMQEGGVGAEEGANALKSGLASLINPTKAATEMLGGFGINLDAIIKANKGDLMGTVMAFSQALQNLDQFQRQQSLEQVFGKFQYAKLGALFENISRQGSQAQQVISTMGYSTEQLGATADRELKTIEQSFGVQLTGAVERFKLAIAPIGEIFVKTAIPIVNWITSLVNKFNELSDGKKQFIAIATIITGVVIPAGTMLLGLLLNLTGTLAKILQGFGAFSKGLITGGPLGAFKALTQSSKYFTLAEIDAANAAQQLAGASQAANLALLEQATAAGAATGAVNALVVSYEKLIAAQTAASGLPGFGVAGEAAKKVKGKTIRRAKGGGVPGVGNTDTVPAMLTPGEFVINKDATKANLPLLEAINGGQKLNSGGMVQFLNRGAIVRSLIELVERKHTTFDDILTKGNYSKEVKDLLSRWLSIRGTGKGSSQLTKEVSKGGKNNFVYRLKSEDNQSLLKSGVDGNSLLKRLLSNSSLETLTATATNAGTTFDRLAYRKAIAARHQELQRMYGKSIRYVDSLDNPATATAIKNNPDIRFLPLSQLHSPDVLKVLTNEHRRILFNTSGSKTYHRYRKPSAKTNEGKVFVKSEYREGDTLPGANDKVKFADSGKAYIGPTRGLQPGDKVLFKDSGKIFQWNGSSWEDTGKTARFASSDVSRPYADITESAFGKRKGTQYTHVVGITPMASGGVVPGSGNKDTVPAMLTPGEFVVNKKAAAQNGQMLKAMNAGGIVSGYEDGGQVSRAGRLAKGAGRVGAGFAGYAIGEKIGGMPGGLIGSIAAEAGFKAIAKFATGKLLPSMTVLQRVIGGTGVGAFVALGFEAYRLQKQVNKAKDAGAEMTRAMYGTAKSTEEMAKFFGRQTRATAATLSAVENLAGPISQEAQQAGTGFVQSDAGKQMLKDLGIVKAGGGNAVEALRNQLSAGIIAGAIGPEEANAIAVEVGNALGDQTLAVSVAGQLNQLLGPDGRDILKNLSTITAEISPKIDSNQLATDAQNAYEKMNIGQKFMQVFSGGGDAFKQDYMNKQVSESIATSFKNEAQALGLLNQAYQEGSISFTDYQKKRAEVSATSGNNLEQTAKILGFNSYNDLVTASQSKGKTVAAGRGTRTVYTQEQQKARGVQEQLKGSYKKSLEDAGVVTDVIDKIMSDADKLGGTIFGDLLSGNIQPIDLQILINQQGNMTPEEFEKFKENLQLMRTIPDVETKFNFNSANAQKDMQDIVDKAGEIEKNPQIEKDFIANDKYTDTFKQFALNYNNFSALDNIEKALVMKHIDEYVTYRAAIVKDRATDPGEVARDLRQLDATIGKQITASMGTANAKTNTKATVDGGANGGGGSGGGKSFKDMKAEMINRFDMVDKLLDREASKYEKVNRILEHQNDLDQQGLDAISKKEDAINKAYDNRIEALDKIEQSNERIKQQEQSRLNLAQALASGNIGQAAAAMSDIQAQNTANNIADTRAALEEARQNALKNITVEINGQLLTREQIEKRIEERELKIKANQNALWEIESKRLANAEAREKAEAKLYLLQQKSYILDLKKRKSKLSASELKTYQEYVTDYNALAKAYGVDTIKANKGGKIMMFGSGNTVPGTGSTDSVPALLTPGEFVVRKAVAERNTPFLQAMNNQLYPSLGAPKYNVPSSDFGGVTGTSYNNSTVYNDTYTINVNVAGTNSSADDIAKIVADKLGAAGKGQIRSRRYNG